MSKVKTGSVSNWDPGQGATTRSNNDPAMSTEAKDHKDTCNATNELKQFVGKSGKPKGPFGVQGREF